MFNKKGLLNYLNNDEKYIRFKLISGYFTESRQEALGGSSELYTQASFVCYNQFHPHT